MHRGKTFSVAFLSVVMLVAMLGGARSACAQQKYPAKPIDFVVAYPPGGAADIAARLVASYMEKKWGTRINVINKPGGNGIPAVLEVLSAAPDGQTLLADITTSYTMMHIALRDLPFKPTDRAILATWGATTQSVFVHPSSPIRNLRDAEAEVKKDPAGFTWTSLGCPSPQDYYLKQFFKVIGADVTRTKPVICKGGAQTVVMVAGGHVKLGVSAITTTLSAAKAGNIRIIAISTGNRWPDLPDIPTAREQGYTSITFTPWVGVSGPLNLPPHVVAAWDRTLQEMLKDTDMQSKFRNVGIESYYHNAQDARTLVLKEIEEGSKFWSSK